MWCCVHCGLCDARKTVLPHWVGISSGCDPAHASSPHQKALKHPLSWLCLTGRKTQDSFSTMSSDWCSTFFGITVRLSCKSFLFVLGYIHSLGSYCFVRGRQQSTAERRADSWCHGVGCNRADRIIRYPSFKGNSGFKYCGMPPRLLFRVLGISDTLTGLQWMAELWFHRENI